MKKTEDIVDLLPVDNEVKKKLLERLNAANPSERLDFTQIIWDVYDWLYDIRFAKNRDIFMAKVAAGEAQLTDESNQELKIQTEKEMIDAPAKHEDDEQIHEIREKLQSLLKR